MRALLYICFAWATSGGHPLREVEEAYNYPLRYDAASQFSLLPQIITTSL